MPARNSAKTYVENSHYRLYNRGVEKRLIFQDDQDYGVFLSYLKQYLLPKDEAGLSRRLSDPAVTYGEKNSISRLLRMNNFSQDITLVAYCLMPNHFHLLVKQRSAGGIDKFMNSLGTRYTMYFNRKYGRVGCLYQGVYRAVLVDRDDQLLHLSRYIDREARGLANGPSSYLDYRGLNKTPWVHPEEILAYFSKVVTSLSYENFVMQSDEVNVVSGLTLEDDQGLPL